MSILLTQCRWLVAISADESRILWHSSVRGTQSERLLEHPAFEVLAVVTQPDKRRVAAIKQPSPVKTVALTHHLPFGNPR